MNFNNVKVPKVPGGGAASALLKVGIIGAIGLYGAANSLYNVEGGHRAIMFNRIVGVKEQVTVLSQILVNFLKGYSWLSSYLYLFLLMLLLLIIKL